MYMYSLFNVKIFLSPFLGWWWEFFSIGRSSMLLYNILLITWTLFSDLVLTPAPEVNGKLSVFIQRSSSQSFTVQFCHLPIHTHIHTAQLYTTVSLSDINQTMPTQPPGAIWGPVSCPWHFGMRKGYDWDGAVNILVSGQSPETQPPKVTSLANSVSLTIKAIQQFVF